MSSYKRHVLRRLEDAGFVVPGTVDLVMKRDQNLGRFEDEAAVVRWVFCENGRQFLKRQNAIDGAESPVALALALLPVKAEARQELFEQFAAETCEMINPDAPAGEQVAHAVRVLVARLERMANENRREARRVMLDAHAPDELCWRGKRVAPIVKVLTAQGLVKREARKTRAEQITDLATKYRDLGGDSRRPGEIARVLLMRLERDGDLTRSLDDDERRWLSRDENYESDSDRAARATMMESFRRGSDALF